MAFGLTLRKSPREEVEQRVRQAAEMLGLGGLLGRKPRELSGGQRQRVALGRAIVRKPSLFLFDEPLSNLDAELRVGMRTELAKLHQKLQTTSVFVTHDQVEAMTMGTKIVVMKDGLVQQTGRPLDVFNRPVNQFVAGFIGSPKMNFIPARLIPAADGLALVANGITLAVPAERVASYGPHVGSEVVLGIRPADIHDRRYAPDAVRRHVISATVDIVEPLGSEAHVYCRAEGTEFMAVLGIQTSYRPQQGIELVFDMTRMHLFASHGDNHRIDVQSAPLRVVNLS
jgi:multiple sugar transport system ATP-binding protein